MSSTESPSSPSQGDDPIRSNIAAIARLERSARRSQTAARRVAEAITRTAGHGAVIVFHAVWFGVWILWNGGLLGLTPFDPFPFMLLGFIVSSEVIFLTLFVLRNQNDLTDDARKRAHLDLQVSLLTERELTLILRMLKDVASRMDVESDSTRDLDALLADTDVAALASKLDAVLDQK